MDALERCPDCGRKSVRRGYGLLGGGCGSYAFCERAACQWSFKERECPMCEGRLRGDGSCDDCGSAKEVRLGLIGPPVCGACMRPIGPLLHDGRCGHICSDGEPCGDDVTEARARHASRLAEVADG